MANANQTYTELTAVFGDISGITDMRTFTPEKEITDRDELEAFLLASLETAAREGERKLAIPAITLSGEDNPADDSARIAVYAVRSFLQEHPDVFDLIMWVVPDRQESFLYTKAILGII